MIAILFVVMVWLDWKYPDAPPVLPLLFLVLAPIAMVAEGLQ